MVQHAPHTAPPPTLVTDSAAEMTVQQGVLAERETGVEQPVAARTRNAGRGDSVNERLFDRDDDEGNVSDDDTRTNARAKDLLEGVPTQISNFLFSRDPAEEDQGRVARDRASTTCRNPSLHCRSMVSRNFMSLLCVLSVAFDDIFEPKSMQEHDLENLVFEAMRTHEGKLITKIGYKDPKGWKQMMKRPQPERNSFIKGAREEVEYGFNHGVFRIMHREAFDGIPLGSLWVFHMKFLPNNMMDKARSRLTIRGDQTYEGIHYNEWDIHAPVAVKATLYIVISIIVQFRLFLTRIDITKAFNAGDLDRPMAMEVPDGFKDEKKYAPYGSNTLWEVLVATYGLKQAASAYYRKFADGITQPKYGYRRLATDGCAFCRGTLGQHDFIIFPIHVDDKIIGYADQSSLVHLQETLTELKLQWNEEGANVILGMQVEYDRTMRKLSLSQRGLKELLVTEAGLSKEPPKSVPCTPESCKELIRSEKPSPESFDKQMYRRFRHLLGVLSHIGNYTMPQMMFSISLISSYMSAPNEAAMAFLLNMILYVKQQLECDFVFTAQEDLDSQDWIYMMSDASLGNRSEKRSQICHLAFLFNNLVHWKSRYTTSVCLSVAESEFMALAAAGQFGCWFQREIGEIGLKLQGPIKIFSDSQAAINICRAPSYSLFTRHIDTRFEWLKSAVRALILHPMFTRGKSNLSDNGTKCTRKHEFVRAAEMMLGIRKKNDFRLFLKHANTFEEQVTKHLKIDNLAAVCFDTDNQGYTHVSKYQPDIARL